MFERFTEKARRVVVYAQEEARMLNQNYIGTEHLLLGLIREQDGIAAKALESLNISLEDVHAQVEDLIGRGTFVPTGHIPFTPRAKKVLELSLREALQLGHNYIGTEHILLGLIREGEGVAAQVLLNLGADLEKVRSAVIQLLSGHYGKQPEAGEERRGPGGQSILDEFGRNLTRQAREGKLDPVIGRAQRDRARDADPVAPHQEQPRAHRRARRGQDGGRRGTCAAHLERRGTRDHQGQAALHARSCGACRWQQVPRRVRGPPQEGHEGDSRARRHHPVRRRDAHARRGRRCRGRDRRRKHHQARSRARRAPDHRRHHARRVPQVRREGPGARAPVPAHPGRRAERRRDGSRSSRDCETATRRTIASRSRTRPSTRLPRWPTATSRTASCPTRRST